MISAQILNNTRKPLLGISYASIGKRYLCREWRPYESTKLTVVWLTAYPSRSANVNAEHTL